eukprot:2274707-Heterocapsa_arctica.AAC.1
MMTEEKATKIAEIMIKIQKPEFLRLEAILENIENIVTVSKEMSEIYFEDIDRQLEQKQHFAIRDRLKEMS